MEMPDLDKSLPPHDTDTGRYRKLHRLVPHDATGGKELYNWRLYIGLSSYAHWLIAMLISAALVTGLPLVGQVAWANDEGRKVDAKIAAAIKPIEQKIDEIVSEQQQQTRVLAEQASIAKAFLAKVASDQVIDSYQRMCKQQRYSPDWRNAYNDYARYLRDYETATGRGFPLQLSCD